MEFLKIYRKVKDVFVKPRLKWYFGTWRNEHNLPVWRKGPEIWLTKHGKGNYYYPQDSMLYFDGYSDREFQGKRLKKYSRSNHKLPGKLTAYTPVWNRKIRKKLKKYYLDWIPPKIQLPIWLSFYFFDNDICWKTKWNQYRYEYPAHITLVFFGLAISVTALPPKVNNEVTLDDDYWETILTYNPNISIKKLNKIMGGWKSLSEEGRFHWRIDPNFFKDQNIKEQLIQLQNGSNAS